MHLAPLKSGWSIVQRTWNGRSAKDIVRIAGPLFAEDGETPAGSLFVVEGESVAVREWAAGDPYAKAGVFASVEIRPFKWVIGNPDA